MAKRAPAGRTRAASAAAKPAPATIIAPNAPAVTPAGEIQAFAGDPNFMASLARGLAVIRAFNDARVEVATVTRRR